AVAVAPGQAEPWGRDRLPRPRQRTHQPGAVQGVGDPCGDHLARGVHRGEYWFVLLAPLDREEVGLDHVQQVVPQRGAQVGGHRGSDWLAGGGGDEGTGVKGEGDRKSTRLNSSHVSISYA